jgi:alkane 1-monooxygenase
MTLMPYCLIFLVPFSVVIGYSLGGAYTFLTPVFVFGVIPALDLLLGISTENPTHEQEELLKDRLSYRAITIVCVPIQVVMVIWGAYVVSTALLTPLEAAGFIFSMGVSSGVMGINVSHELQHRVNLRGEPFLARVMLCTVLYMHWAIEHVAGHHKNVATPEDPATARYGEPFYAFWLRTVFGGMASAWNIEAARLKRKGIRVFNLRNRIIYYAVSELVLVVTLFATFGSGAGEYFIIQSIIAFTLLEIVNYVEHYGLLRMKDSRGRYEPVNFLHAWNSSNWLTNRFLFNLQRHSDHHYKPDRRYQILRHFDESPQLPTGYAGMILLAAIPPLWRSVMDPRVREYRAMGKKAALEPER